MSVKINLKSIIEGHLNEAFNKNVDIFNDRIKICVDCDLYTIKYGLAFVGP